MLITAKANLDKQEAIEHVLFSCTPHTESCFCPLVRERFDASAQAASTAHNRSGEHWDGTHPFVHNVMHTARFTCSESIDKLLMCLLVS